ncbi:MAG TPA: 2-oxo acid dehydrogenase subunit E2 [Fimbriimonadaceae bacterium]|nr:2-oxo acid dehydrogenase subunit E2 [Fimbriimonadaceae bacterium]
MPSVSVRIPQIGEGLQEARLVAVLKQPGDKIKRDEPIYQMETDKAVMDVESPYEGVLLEWMAPVDTILPIGGEVARMEVGDGVQEVAVGHGPAPAEPAAAPAASTAATAADGSRNANIPPRTRAYAKEKGVSDADLAKIPSAGSKLMPSDIDAYLAGGATAGPKRGAGYTETAVGQKQRLLSSRLVRGNQLVVPGTISVAVDWEPIENLRSRIKAKGGDFQPSVFTIFAYAVAQAVKDFPGFRTTLVNDDTMRTYDHVALGIAVALPGDDLVLAVVPDADALSWRDFAAKTRERIDVARGGQDQANEAVTISLTNMQNFGLRDAVPVVVPPSVATLFLGEVYNGLANDTSELKLRRLVNLALTFDHRVMNGVGAANFLNKVKGNLESIGGLVDIE